MGSGLFLVTCFTLMPEPYTMTHINGRFTAHVSWDYHGGRAYKTPRCRRKVRSFYTPGVVWGEARVIDWPMIVQVGDLSSNWSSLS